MNEYLLSSLCSSVLVGYGSVHMLTNYLGSLDPHSSYLEWFEGQVEKSKETVSFKFFYSNVLDCVRYLLCQIAYQEDLVYILRHELDPNGERIYADMHTSDQWTDVQEHCPTLLYLNIC